MVEICAHGPARLYGARGKGRIAPGFDADLTLVDLGAERVVEDSWIASRCGWTPFHGARLRGWPMATLLRGQAVVREGELLGSPRGLPVAFDL